MNDYTSRAYGDLDSPSRCTSIAEDARLHILDLKTTAAMDNDRRRHRDCDNDNDRITGMTFSDPVTLAVLNDFNAGTSLPPPLTPVIEIDDAEDKTPFNAEREIEKMDISDASPSDASAVSASDSRVSVSEETIVPCLVAADKGAFITKIDSGGVHFVEIPCSPDEDSAVSDRLLSPEPASGCGPMVLHIANAVATPTSIIVGDRVHTGKSGPRREPTAEPTKIADPAPNRSHHPERKKSAPMPPTPPLHTPSTADSGIGPVSVHSNSSPFEFPAAGGPNLTERSRHRLPSTQSSGIMSTSSLSASSSTSSGSEMSPKDVMISYSHTDRDMMKKIKARLEEAGISVWVDSDGLRSGVDFLSKIGQAIIDAKLFVSLVSPKSLQSKFCRDELSLAYISDKFLFPVALHSLDALVPVMDTGLKLVLTRLEWTLLYEEREFDKRMTDLVLRMKKRIEQKTTEPSIDSLSVRTPPMTLLPPPSGADRRNSFQTQSKTRRSWKQRQCLNRQHSIYKNASTPQFDSDGSGVSLGVASMSLTPSLEENTAVLFFWERNFSGADVVPWSKFRGEFLRQYGDELDKAYDKKEQEWMLEILFKELVVNDADDDDAAAAAAVAASTLKEEEEDAERQDRQQPGVGKSSSSLSERKKNSSLKKKGIGKESSALLSPSARDNNNKQQQLVLKSKYVSYCNVDGDMNSFWMRLQDQAMEKLAMKDVFGIESCPAYRLKAVENLAKFKSPAVLGALLELLDDDDPNVRAIAAISVSKLGADRSSSSSSSSSSFEDVDDVLLRLLQEDNDRLVRESVCIAFGHRRTAKAVPHLVTVWRNDNISSVRDAAQAALRRVGGEEADSAIQMTEILQDEMKTLTDLAGPA